MGTADPFLNIETTNDLIGLKQQAQAVSGNQLQGGSYAQSVLSGATFDTSLLDQRNRPQRFGSDGVVDASTIEIDFDDLRSAVTDITDNDTDAQTILSNATNIQKWD